jgi:hypothetical protein
MVTLETVGLVIAFLVALGRYLDSEHVESRTKDVIRLGLIKMYILLYDLPKYLSRRFSALADRAYKSPEIDVRTGKTISPRSEHKWAWYGYYYLAVPLLTVIFAYMTQYVFKEDEWTRHVGFTKESAWWFGLFGGGIIFINSLLIVTMLVGMVLIAVAAVALLPLLIVEIIRRIALVVLNKSTDPKRSPFSYFAALLSVVAALVGLLKHLFSEA